MTQPKEGEQGLSSPVSQFGLLKQKRFLPFFITQFLGALNDNLFRNALLLLVTFHGLSSDALAGFENGVLVNFAMALFMLPWFIFSPIAGQLAEKYEKARLIQITKLAEVVIMLLAGFAFYTDSLNALMLLLFLMGTQSAFFGPVKYAILPQHLHEEELVGGNGMVEMATFVGILLGVMLGGQLVVQFAERIYIVAGSMVLVAVAGWLTSCYIPKAMPLSPELKLNWNLFSETASIIRLSYRNRVVWLSVLGNCWFWAFGGVVLAQLPEFAQTVLGGNETSVMGMYAVFSIGIGVGSLLCEKLSKGVIEPGLVPIGAIGLTVFGIDIWAVDYVRPEVAVGFLALIEDPAAQRILLDMGMLGLSGGLFLVPLYALIQARSEVQHRSRIMAANNVISALMMVAASGLAAAGLAFGMTIPEVFLVGAILNGVVTLYLFKLMPVFVMRMLVWMIVGVMYRVSRRGMDNIPATGAVVLVCNHISFMDALLLSAATRRPIRFVMDQQIFKIPVASFIFRTAEAIPIAPEKIDADCLRRANNSIAEALEAGEVVCIFPEGAISRDGEMIAFKSGIERIVQRTPAPVVPMALRGMWGSFFSRKNGSAMQRFPRRFLSKVQICAAPAIQPEAVNAQDLYERVSALRGDWK